MRNLIVLSILCLLFLGCEVSPTDDIKEKPRLPNTVNDNIHPTILNKYKQRRIPTIPDPIVESDITDDVIDVVDDMHTQTDYVVPTVIVGDIRADIYEVTIDAYCAVMGEDKRDELERIIRGRFGDAYDVDDDYTISGMYPAIVTQSEARQYAENRGGVKLPTHRDYAIMMDTDNGKPVLGNVLYDRTINAASVVKPKPVNKSCEPNASGIHNLYGNATEWIDADFMKIGLKWDSRWPSDRINAFNPIPEFSEDAVSGFRCVEDINNH